MRRAGENRSSKETNRSEIDHEAEGLRADDWELHVIDDGDDVEMMIYTIYNLQLAKRGHRFR
jgi:hypothetical protein